jgi:hypothetical protein
MLFFQRSEVCVWVCKCNPAALTNFRHDVITAVFQKLITRTSIFKRRRPVLRVAGMMTQLPRQFRLLHSPSTPLLRISGNPSSLSPQKVITCLSLSPSAWENGYTGWRQCSDVTQDAQRWVHTCNVTAWRNAVTLQVTETIRSYDLNFNP